MKEKLKSQIAKTRKNYGMQENWKERESTVRKQNEELKINITIKITRCD